MIVAPHTISERIANSRTSVAVSISTSSVARGGCCRSGRARAGTVLTYPDGVENVRAQGESLRGGHVVERSLEPALQIGGEVHVGHRTTDLAREVVMVADERLGELEPGEVAD